MFHDSLFRSRVRRFSSVCAALIAPVAAVFGQTPSAADGFDPNVDGNVYAVAAQGDKVVIGGQFTSLQPNASATSVARANLARLNVDGTVDTAFDVQANGPVRAIAVQAGGQIVIGGDFTQLQVGGVSVTRNRLARLHANGTLDTAFNPNLSGSLQPQVTAIVSLPDNRLVVGGRFTTVQPTGAAASTARRNLVRLTAAGAVDASFDPSPNGMVLALALHSDGKVLVGGGFTGFQANGATTLTTRNRIARLNTNGTVDENFDPNASNAVSAIALQRDGKILLGGSFATLQPLGAAAASSRSRLARLNVDGTLDTDFAPAAGGNVSAISLQSDGSILIGGAFTTVWGRGSGSIARSYLARFAPDGTADADFDSGLNAEVAAIASLSDGRLVVGGYFTRARTAGASVALVRNRVARLNANGSLDAAFALSAGGRPLVSAVQADGKIVIGGSFTTVGGATHNYLARLNADGSVDSTYNPDFNGRVLALAVEASSGKMIVGGTFTAVNNVTRNRLARLNANGSLDTDFDPNVDGTVAAIVLQSDGKILIGGAFNSLQPAGTTTATFRANVARLTAAGAVDTPFDPNVNASVTSIVVQSDGKIVLGGDFTITIPNSSATQYTRSRMARFNADGTVDTTYDPNFNGQVNGLALQSDGKIIAVGAFSLLQPNGISTVFTRNRIVRLNVDGTVDTAFDPNVNGTIFTVALQSDQKVLIGGLFTTVHPAGQTNWSLRKYVARLNTDGTVDSGFNLDLNETVGNRVESIRVLSDGRILFTGAFASLQPDLNGPRTPRANIARVNANGSLDAAFDVDAAGSTSAIVNALAVQADGKVIAAGSFSDLGGSRTTNIARFHPEGTADASFSAALATDGPVHAVAIRANIAQVSTQLPGFAWLNAGGSLRTAFAPSADARFSGRVNAALVLPDGRLLIAGSFNNLSGATTGNIALFAANGTLDTSFNPSINGEVLGFVRQDDGRIVIVGTFSQVNGTTRSRIARLETSGALDAGYDPNVNGPIYAVALQTDGRVLIGGSFSGITPNGTTTTVARSNLARLNTDGTVDNYLPNPLGTVRALALQPDGKVLAGGDFISVQPGATATATDRRYLARFNPDGGLDGAFDPNPNNSVFALAVQSDGAVVVGGSFTTLQPNAGTTTSRYYIARVNTHGALDTAYNPYPNGSVLSLALQPDGTLLVGGLFSTFQPNGGTAIARHRVARLNADGSLDAAFNPDVTGAVSTVASTPTGGVLVSGSLTGLQPNGVVVVGGAFNTIGGISARRLALLSNDGSVANFLPQPNGDVRAILTLPDGRFLVGGDFTSIAGGGRNRIARFNADGTIDTAFNCSIDGSVRALALQADGRILVGGQFSNVNGVARVGLARLDPNGSLDGTFAPVVNLSGIDITALSLAVQPDGRILVLQASAPALGFVGWASSSLVRLNSNGTVDTSFATVSTGEAGIIRSMALQTDGRIVLGGSFSGFITVSPAAAAPAWLARVNANGTVDTSFNPQPNGPVTAIALQSDGRIMLGGGFTKVGGLTRIGLARLASTGAERTLAVTMARNRVAWITAGALGQMSAVRFEISTNRATWTVLGSASRAGTIGGYWVLDGVQLPATGSFFIRAVGIAPAGAGSGVYEEVREFNYASPAFSPTALQEGGVSVPEWSYFDPFTGLHYGMLYPNGVAVEIGVIARPAGAKISGNATEVGTDIRHANGNIYDQILLQGDAATITADSGQVARISYLSLNNEIVQVEFSGAGSLTLSLDSPAGPVVAENYNQPEVAYMKGHGKIIVLGADETTNLSVFSVGPLTAVNQALFRDGVAYAGVADLAYVAISSANGKFGGLRSGNANYFATTGLTGVYAPGVQFNGPVNVHDINGYDNAVAMLVVGSAQEVRIAGGDLFQANGQPLVVNAGGANLEFVSGVNSHAKPLPVQANRAEFEQLQSSATK